MDPTTVLIVVIAAQVMGVALATFGGYINETFASRREDRKAAREARVRKDEERREHVRA